MKTSSKILLLIVSVLITSYSFGGPHSSKDKESWIPADFDPRKTTLLVAKFEWHIPEKAVKRNEEMDEEMKKSYPYPYEFATSSEIRKDSKYQDKDKYRYALMWTQASQGTAHGSAGQPIASASTSNPIFHFYIYDRKLDKSYPQNPKFNSYIVRVFKPTLEELMEYLKQLKN